MALRRGVSIRASRVSRRSPPSAGTGFIQFLVFVDARGAFHLAYLLSTCNLPAWPGDNELKRQGARLAASIRYMVACREARWRNWFLLLSLTKAGRSRVTFFAIYKEDEQRGDGLELGSRLGVE